MSMVEYNKIETVYRRDEKTKKLVVGEFNNPTLEFCKDLPWTFTEKVDGCLCGKTRVVMADGKSKPISQIKEGELVIGYDINTNEWKIVPVLASQRKPEDGEWIKITTTRKNMGSGNSFGTIRCTHDHKIWTKNRGYVEAYKLQNNDILISVRSDLENLTPIQEQVLIGKMLGDGSYTYRENEGLNTGRIEWGQKEEEYTNWCITALGDLAKKSADRISGYGTEIHVGRTKNTVAIYEKFNKWVSCGHKEVPEDLKLTPISIAFWYMDDGSLVHWEGQEDRVHFATNGFNEKSCEILLRELEKFDIYGSVQDRKGNTICLNSENAEKMFLLVAPYICACKKYKLPERYRDSPSFIPHDIEKSYHKMIVEQDIISIEKESKKYERWDIQTETHNFFTTGGLVHNSNIRVGWDGHTVTFGGRTDKAQMPVPLINRLNELFGGEANAQLFEQKFGETEVILFGEGYGPKIQNGGGYRNDVDFIIFDAMIAGNYQPRSSVEDIAQYFGIDIVPIVLEGTIAEGVDYVLHNRKSLIARNGALIEGLVGRPKIELRDRVGKRLICKIKFKDFE